MDKCCGILGWFGIRDAIDGWRIEARPSVRSVFDSPEQSGPVLPFFAKLDFLFRSGAIGGLWRPCARVVGFQAVFSLEESIVTCVQHHVVVVLF
jgi:hypothetical protein